MAFQQSYTVVVFILIFGKTISLPSGKFSVWTTSSLQWGFFSNEDWRGSAENRLVFLNLLQF